MKSDRPGDFLWQEWEGSGYDPRVECSVIYYTFDHIDLDNDLVRRALASALQRDGVAISLGDGFNLIDCYHIDRLLNILEGRTHPQATSNVLTMMIVSLRGGKYDE